MLEAFTGTCVADVEAERLRAPVGHSGGVREGATAAEGGWGGTEGAYGGLLENRGASKSFWSICPEVLRDAQIDVKMCGKPKLSNCCGCEPCEACEAVEDHGDGVGA